MDRNAARIDADVAKRFEMQNLAIGSLRAMVAQTDELLNKVLENLEAMDPPAEEKRQMAGASRP